MQISLCEDPTKWNREALGLGGTLYHSWECGELWASQGWRPWRLCLIQDGIVRAVTNIMERRIPALGFSIQYAPCGIAVREDDVDAVGETLVQLQGFMRDRRAIVLRFDPRFGESNNAMMSVFLKNGCRRLTNQWSFWNLPRSMMILDLRPTEQELFRNLRQKHRQHINRFDRLGMALDCGEAPALLEDLYRLLNTTARRRDFSVRDLNYFVHLHSLYVSRGRGLIVVAKHSGTPVGALLCTRFGKTCYALYTGTDDAHHELHVSEAMHWRSIQWAKSLGCEEFNLIGSGTSYPPREGNRGYGIYHFKRGLGAELMYSAGYFDLELKPLPYRLFRFAEKNPRLIDTARKVRSFF